jgi:hypothetical protein
MGFEVFYKTQKLIFHLVLYCSATHALSSAWKTKESFGIAELFFVVLVQCPFDYRIRVGAPRPGMGISISFHSPQFPSQPRRGVLPVQKINLAEPTPVSCLLPLEITHSLPTHQSPLTPFIIFGMILINSADLCQVFLSAFSFLLQT